MKLSTKRILLTNHVELGKGFLKGVLIWEKCQGDGGMFGPCQQFRSILLRIVDHFSPSKSAEMKKVFFIYFIKGF